MCERLSCRGLEPGFPAGATGWRRTWNRLGPVGRASPRPRAAGDGKTLDMNTKHYDPHGQALTDYFAGDTAASIAVYGDDGGLLADVPLSLFFRTPAEFPPMEHAAIELCRGRVLEFGAGTGCHGLALQERGLDICAIDFLPVCADIARRRGVRNVRVADIYTFDDGPFDTLLSLMNGLGVVPTLSELEPFLLMLRRRVRSNGQLLIDSVDLRKTDRFRARYGTVDGTGPFHAELRQQLEYKGRRGPVFSQLMADPQTLFDHAIRAGWKGRVVEQDETGRYLAQLVSQDG